MTYQEVYLMDNLTIEAKAIYGMLCSYAGSGDTAYPSVDFICSKLHITKTRFYKHMNLLIGAGVVEKKAIRNEAGLFSSNVYRLLPNGQNIQNPYTEKWYSDNLCSDNLYTENHATNNNSFNNNSLNNNSINTICPKPEKPAPDRKPEDESGILLSLNDGTKYNVPLSKIKIWADAYPAVDVKQELLKMSAWLDSNRTKRKTRRGIDRFINNWLSRTQDHGGTRNAAVQTGQVQKPQTRFNNFDQRSYDYADLERQLLNSQK